MAEETEVGYDRIACCLFRYCPRYAGTEQGLRNVESRMVVCAVGWFTEGVFSTKHGHPREWIARCGQER